MELSVGDRATVAGSRGEDIGELAAGERVGQYEILRLLGRGGMGQVYLARHRMQESLHALKILPTEFSGLPGFVGRFNTELRIMASMQHPNIVHVQYSDVADGRYYLVMDFVGADGTESPYDLNAALKTQSRLAAETVRRLALQLCEGLGYAHARGVIHRDLKPANVLLTSKQVSRAEAKICDFGLARVLGEEQVQAREAEKVRRSMSMGDRDTVGAKKASEGNAGGVLGTYGYMSPEQEEGKPADARSDLYAMGVILYRMLTGQRPMGLAKPASQIVRSLDPAWDAIIAKCLEIDPAARWQTVGELKKALEGLQGKKAVAAGKKAKRFGVLVVAAAVLGCASLAYVRSEQTRKEREAAIAAERAKLLADELEQIKHRTSVARAQQKAKEDERLNRETEQKRLADEQVKAKKDWLSGLRDAAEAALLADDLESAGEKIAQLKREEGADAVLELQKKYEARTSARDTNRRYAEALEARKKTAGMDRRQGFGQKLDNLEDIWKQAEAARKNSAWGQACSRYDDVISECNRLETLVGARDVAAQWMSEAEKAQAGADAAAAAQKAKSLFDKGGLALASAGKLFESGDFAAAAKAWQAASSIFSEARAYAEAVEGWSKAKRDYEAAFAPEAMLLEKHGGPKWADVQKKVLAGELSENSPVERRSAYEAARVGLSAALTEARVAEREARLNGSLSAAKQAKAAGQWQACVEQADAVLALNPGHAEAQALRSEAVNNLTTALAVTAEAGGREVAAIISDGRSNYTSPQTIALTPGETYSFTVSYKPKASAVRYKEATLQGKVDWKGVRPWVVKLEEVKGPFEGENWTSPSTRMEFVWVPKLKIWVGKYEVMNQEYRRKVPAHDSKDFKGRILDGDRQPVVLVNFSDAVAYAAWLTDRDKERLGEWRYRLPSEAEWLAFAQCGDGRSFPWGNEMPPKYGNYADASVRSVGLFAIEGCKDGEAVTCDVEKSGENDWGLYGVGGNVWECCALDAGGTTFGAWRGASWYLTYPERLRCSYRNNQEEALRTAYNGFRLVLSR